MYKKFNGKKMEEGCFNCSFRKESEIKDQCDENIKW